MVSVAKPALLFMLMLATAMVAQGAVTAINRCPLPIIVNGKHIPKGLEVDIELLLNASHNLVVEVLDVTGKLVTGSYYCPSEVTELTCTQVDAGLQIVVTGVSSLLLGLLGTVAGLLDQVLGLVLGTLACTLAWLICVDNRLVGDAPHLHVQLFLYINYNLPSVVWKV